MPAQFAPYVGQRVTGRFELKSFLRGGGPARVFLAADGSGTEVPLVLLDPASCSPEAWAAFARVVTATTAAAIPGLVPLRGVDATPPTPPHCLADPQVGWSFDRLRREAGPPSWQRGDEPIWVRALQLGERIAEILDAAHAATGAPHLALIAARCVVTEHDEVKLLDYGIGELEPAEGRPDDVGYRAPEQQGGRGDHRSDVYSLAAVLYELISGERPSPSIPPKLRAHVARVPHAVDHLFAKALARDPALRFRNIASMRASIREFLGLSPVPPAAIPVRLVLAAATPVKTEQCPEELATAADIAGPPLLPSSLTGKLRRAEAETRPTSSDAQRSLEDMTGTAPPKAGAPLIPQRKADLPQGKLAAASQLTDAREPPTERPPFALASARGLAEPTPLNVPPMDPFPLRLEHPPVDLAADRTEVLKVSTRKGDVDRTEVLNPSVRQGDVDKTEVLARPTASASPHADTTATEGATLVFRRQMSVPRATGGGVAKPEQADSDRTLVELRRLSRVIHADSTLELPRPDSTSGVSSPSRIPPRTAAAARPEPANGASPPAPDALGAENGGPTASEGPRYTAWWRTQRMLTINVALLLLVLLGLLVSQ